MQTHNPVIVYSGSDLTFARCSFASQCKMNISGLQFFFGFTSAGPSTVAQLGKELVMKFINVRLFTNPSQKSVLIFYAVNGSDILLGYKTE